MYTRSTENGIEIVFNNQTVPILVLCVKALCGIDLLSFKKIAVHLNPINSLVDRHAHEPIVTLWDVSWMSCSVFRVRIRVATRIVI